MKVQSNYLHFSITIQLYRVSLFLSLCLPLSLFLVKGNTFSVTIYLSFVSHHSIAKYANVLRNLLCIIQTSPLFSLPLSTYSRVEIVYKLKLYLLCSLLIIIIIIIIIARLSNGQTRCMSQIFAIIVRNGFLTSLASI